mgnify:FL=1
MVFLSDKEVGSEYWDNIWGVQSLVDLHRNPRNILIEKVTRKYIPKKEKLILEAGCGNAQYVRLLNNLGYNCCGIDYAETTVSQLNKFFPELQIYKRDVRDTEFDNDSFDGYWSIGVIEHFVDTYDLIVDEARRIMKRDGFAFISFPYISPMRRLKILLRRYPAKDYVDEYCIKHFNQYAMEKEQVISVFREKGFRYVASYKYNGILGWIEEVSALQTIMNGLYSSISKHIKVPRFILNYILSIIMSHCILLVFQKK